MKSSTGILLVYDCTNSKSFKNIDYWIDFAKERCNQETKLYLVANKCDLDL